MSVAVTLQRECKCHAHRDGIATPVLTDVDVRPRSRRGCDVVVGISAFYRARDEALALRNLRGEKDVCDLVVVRHRSCGKRLQAAGARSLGNKKGRLEAALFL
jgi:hypothetical protein